ncbi:hypothetical protein [Thalassospira sp. CH_XMU1448-2]|uniref:hypothetical protein n=1 Tax=Thalassospira sp. CH_XMU1448-2 TaxID=3107773 RepID=UPI00300A8480
MSWIKNLVFTVLFSLILLFAVLEVWRLTLNTDQTADAEVECEDVYWPSRFTEGSGYSSFVPETTLVWSNYKDFCGVSLINSLGYPDQEPQLGDAIVLLGDSFIEQAQLSLSKKEKVQQKLAELYVADNIAVPNIVAVGYSGTGQTAQSQMLKEVMQSGVRPSDVVLLVVPNDVRDNSIHLSSIVNDYAPEASPRPYYIPSSNTKGMVFNKPVLAEGGYFSKRNPWTLEFVLAILERYEGIFGNQLPTQLVHLHRLNELKEMYPGNEYYESINYIPKQYDAMFASTENEPKAVRFAWEATEQSIKDIKEVCNGCRLHAVFNYQFSMPIFSELRHRFVEILDKHQIRHDTQFFDPEFHWENDGHWNPKGTQDAAEVIFGLLKG